MKVDAITKIIILSHSFHDLSLKKVFSSLSDQNFLAGFFSGCSLVSLHFIFSNNVFTIPGILNHFEILSLSFSSVMPGSSSSSFSLLIISNNFSIILGILNHLLCHGISACSAP